MSVTTRSACRICRSTQLIKFLDLGMQPLANAFVRKDAVHSDESRFPLEVYLCGVCHLVQLVHVVDHVLLFSDYIYFSSHMPKLAEHFGQYAQDVVQRFMLTTGGLVVEMGSNDGILLQHFKKNGARVLGVDPAKNIAEVAQAAGIPTIVDFFCERVAVDILQSHGRARVIVGNNVVAHIDDYQDLGRAVKLLLDHDGVFVFEAPYLVDMFERTTFDTVYHEHLNYLAVRPLLRWLDQFDLEMFDVQQVAAQGKSLRVFVGHRGVHRVQPSVQACVQQEIALGLNTEVAYTRLAEAIHTARQKTIECLTQFSRAGKKIVAYGAPAKGNTVLNFYNLGTDLITCALDDMPSKQGLYTPGQHIPVVSRDQVRQHTPDVYFLLAWNYASVILDKEKDFMEKGGVFVLPTGEVIRHTPSTSPIAVAKDGTKKILVTGGAGFIGSNFVRYLYETYPDYCIYNYDALTYSGNRNNLVDIEQKEQAVPLHERRYIFVQGDICNREMLDRLCADHAFAAIINFAAESHVDRSLVSSFDFIRSNVVGVHTLLEVCRTHHIPRFVQISTDEVYGDVADGFADERQRLAPSNPYSAAKASADLLIQSYMRSHQLPALIVRGSNNVGPYQYPEKLIPLAISNMLEGKKIPIHGSGAHIRSWLFVRDFCTAIDAVLQRGIVHETYNVAGTQKSNLQVIEAVRNVMRLQTPIHVFVHHTNDRPGADLRYAPDGTKIQRDLGWKPAYTFERAMEETVQWYMHHEAWWKPLKEQQAFLDHYERQQHARYF